MWGYAHTCVGMHMQRRVLDVLLHHSLARYLETGVLLSLELGL